MNIVSFNIACMPKYMNLLGNVNKRLEAIQLILKNLNADIILLQEVFSNYSRNILTTFFKNNNYNILLSPNTKLYLNGGLLIATKHKIINSNYYIYKNYFGEDSLSYKGILYGQININDKIIHIFNTHTNNIKPLFNIFSNSYKLFNKQLKEFINYVNYIKKKFDKSNYKINQNNISYILAGDLNLNNTSKLYKTFIKKLQKKFNVCVNKKKIITDNQNNIQIDYIINCYNKNIPYIPHSNTINIKNTFYSDHNILIKYIS